MSSSFGVDPGSYGGLQSCRLVKGKEVLESAVGNSDSLHPLPAVVLTAERGRPSLEARFPLLPLGTGAAWPPEAQVSTQCGSRRIPLALALALLQSGRSPWAWPTYGVGAGPQRETGQLGLLVREGVEAGSRECKGPIALPVSGLLPIEVQTELSSRRFQSTHAAEEVRLLWRSMALGIGMLGPWDGSSQTGALRAKAGELLLHVHLGIDGFEASLLSIQPRTGDKGPQLLVPARKRPIVAGDPAASDGVTACSAPLAGVRLMLAALRAKGAKTIPQLWEAAFTLPEARVIPDSSDYSHGGTDSVVWADAFRSVDANTEIDQWIAMLSAVVVGARNSVTAVLLSGQYSRSDWWGNASIPRLAGEMTRVLKGLGVQTHLVPTGAISAGAALFASRRANGWATYLDELPAVEMVVQRADGPGWIYAIKPQTFYDAGKPAFERFENFGRLSAGADKLLLPALVEGYGSVRESSIAFDRPTENVQSVDLETEMEAASGLPVVRARLPGLEGRAAELNWAASSDTGRGKQEYLDSLPQQFPPLEIRVESKWWANGQDQTRLQVSGVWMTCDEACRAVASERNLAKLEEYFDLLGKRAQKREWIGSGNQRRLQAASDSQGKNRWAQHLPAAEERAVQVLATSAYGSDLWKSAARFLAYIKHGSATLERLILKQLDDLRVCGENDQLLALAGNCIQTSAGSASVLEVLSRRIMDKVEEAQADEKAPVGIFTMKSMSSLLATRADATSMLSEVTASRLSKGVTRFIELGVKYADAEQGLHQRFRAGIKSLVFLLRRRAYDSGYLGESTREFSIAIRSCCIAGLVSQMRQGARGVAGAKIAFTNRLGLDSEHASDATRRTRSVLARLTEAEIPRPLPRVNDEAALDLLVEQVVRYIEGRGAGIIVIPD